MRMRTPITLSTLLVLFCCLGVAVETRAQAVTGYTEIDYDAATDTLDAYSETDLDEELIGEYDAYVSLTIRDGNFSVIAQGSEEDQWNGVASVELFYSGTTPDTTYTAKGFHKPIADLWDYDYEWPYYTYYYDDYNFTSFENQGINEPWYYYWLSPGWQEIHRRSAPISLGSTHDDIAAVLTPPPPSVAFTTAKIYHGAQAGFNSEGGVQIAHLAATGSECDPNSSFTLTVNFSPPEQTRSLDVFAKGFGTTSVSNWNVEKSTINTNFNPDARPPTGTASMTVNNKNGGHTVAPYDVIQVTVHGSYNSGANFSTLGKVQIQCP